MKAQVLHSYDPDMKQDVWVKEEEVPNPEIDKASDVIIKIGAAGVCRTDLHVIEGEWRHIQDPDDKLLPCVMGHENAGWIEDVGSDVEGFKKGDAVILRHALFKPFAACFDSDSDCCWGGDNGAWLGLDPAD